jgi:NTE family protein
LAHIGVLQVLDEAGIRIHAVTGASVGSLIGAAVAKQMPMAEIDTMARRVRWRHLMRPVWPRQGILSFAPLERFVITIMGGDIDIADLPLPYACTATDVLTGETAIFKQGRLAPRIRASCSIPGLIRPIEIDGVAYVDGGVTDNLPIAAMRTLPDIDVVLAVNLFGPATYLPSSPMALALTAVGHTLSQAGSDPGLADVLIEPDCTGFGIFRFQYDPLVTRGREAMTAQLERLKALLS